MVAPFSTFCSFGGPVSAIAITYRSNSVGDVRPERLIEKRGWLRVRVHPRPCFDLPPFAQGT
jgi:hypothetical protein